MPPIPTGLSEPRYVSAIPWKEFLANGQPATGGKWIFHHALMNMLDADGNVYPGAWPSVTTTGRFGWVFEPGAGQLLAAGSQLLSPLGASARERRRYDRLSEGRLQVSSQRLQTDPAGRLTPVRHQ